MIAYVIYAADYFLMELDLFYCDTTVCPVGLIWLGGGCTSHPGVLTFDVAKSSDKLSLDSSLSNHPV